MPTLHLLGTGAALSDGSRTTTMLALEDGASTLIVDCGGDVIQRAQAGGIDPDTIDALFLTHEHADHVAGFPLLMERLWLSPRRKPLPVFGPATALDQARRCFGTFDTSSWDALFELEWHEVPLDDHVEVLSDEHWTVRASPGEHGTIDVVGLRFTHAPSGATMTYSGDTSPTPTIADLARGADILVHEATGHPNHSTVEEAAEIAAAADVGQLILVHLPPHISDEALEPVRATFDGAVALGYDGDTYDLS